MIDQIDYSEEWSTVNDSDRVWPDIDNIIATLEHKTEIMQLVISETDDKYIAYMFVKGVNNSVSLISAKSSDDKDAIKQAINNLLYHSEVVVKALSVL